MSNSFKGIPEGMHNSLSVYVCTIKQRIQSVLWSTQI